ncbi:MAG: DNA-binding protein, partial [Candidatus Binataceae bacterium]
MILTWCTAREIAAAKLPGLPHSRFGVRKYAPSHGWTARSKDGNGGQQSEYLI